MYVRHVRPTVFAAIALLVVAGCSSSGGGTEPTADQLTEAEAGAVLSTLYQAMTEPLFSAFSAPTPAGVDGPALSTDQFSASSSCSGGGTVDVQVSVTENLDNQGSGSTSITENATLNGCSAAAATRQLSMTGSTSATASWQYSNWDAVGNVGWHMSGNINWSGGTGSGTCSVDLTVSLDVNTFHGTMSGSACGQSYSQSI